MAKNKKGGNYYDRILKENAYALIIHYLAQFWDLDLSSASPLPTKFTRTREREVDYLYKLKDKKGDWIILHLEFQSTHDAEMLERIQEYHGMIYRIYRLPIKHVLIYLGEDRMRMRNQLPLNHQFRGFEVISLRDIALDQLLTSQVPEVLVLAILANSGMEPPEKVLRSIVEKLNRLVDQPHKRYRYFNQLMLLSGLRSSKREALEKLLDMPLELAFDPEDDFLYKRATARWKAEIERVKEEAKKAAKEAAEKERRVQNRRIANMTQQLLQKGLDKHSIAQMLDYSLAELQALLDEFPPTNT